MGVEVMVNSGRKIYLFGAVEKIVPVGEGVMEDIGDHLRRKIVDMKFAARVVMKVLVLV